MTEVCKWTIDISSLPTFIHNARTHEGGFFTGNVPQHFLADTCQMFVPEFEVGLEFDSGEIRGILLYNNQEWAK